MQQAAEMDRLAAWAIRESQAMARANVSEPGSLMEREAIRAWKAQRPDLYLAMQERQALRALAHVLVEKTVQAQLEKVREGMPLSDARLEAYAENMMMDPGAMSPPPQPEPTIG